MLALKEKKVELILKEKRAGLILKEKRAGIILKEGKVDRDQGRGLAIDQGSRTLASLSGSLRRNKKRNDWTWTRYTDRPVFIVRDDINFMISFSITDLGVVVNT